MRVIGGKERPDALLAPGVDFIMEHAIQQDAGERVIDTFIDFVPPSLTRLNGRKYIGENTVKDLAKLIGYVPGDTAQKIQDAFDAYKAQVQTVFASLDAVSADIQDVVKSGISDPNDIRIETPPDAAAMADAAQVKQQSELDTITQSEDALAAAANQAAATVADAADEAADEFPATDQEATK